MLGPVLFNIYLRSIYKCVEKLGFKIFGYADDHQILKIFIPAEQVEVLTGSIVRCFSVIKDWMARYYLQMNDSKTQFIVFGTSAILNQIRIGGVTVGLGITIRFVNVVKNLGMRMDNVLSFTDQVMTLKKSCFRTIRILRKIRFLLSEEQCKIIVNSMVVMGLDYCNSLYYGISENLLRQLQLIQNAAAKVVTCKYKHDHMDNDLEKLHWLCVKKRILFKIGLISFKAVNGWAPDCIIELFRYSNHERSPVLLLPKVVSNVGRRSFSFIAPKFYNSLPTYVKSSSNLAEFKKCLKFYLFTMNMSKVDGYFK